MSRDGKYAILRMPSGETRMILQACKATIGSVSNADHNLEKSGKAGRSRWLGRRPHNRGVVMNPVDHPMGGGEGRASGGHPRSRKGLPAKGYKASEIMAAYKEEGSAFKKKEEIHRMADANKAFSHFRF